MADTIAYLLMILGLVAAGIAIIWFYRRHSDD